MKLGNLLFAASLLIGSVTLAQDGDTGEDRECKRLRVVANNAMSFTNYREATSYFLKAEALCDEFGKDNYDRLISCAMEMAIQTEGDEKKAYIDTLLGAWDRSDEKGFYDQADDLNRGYYYLYGTTPNYVKADFFMGRALNNIDENFNEQFLPLYYYNVYTMWYIEQDEEAKTALKQRIIKEYFWLSKVINENNFSPKTQETLTQYMRIPIQSCDDILPEMPKFMETLPEDAETKKTLMMDMAYLLSDIGCEETDEFGTLAKALYELDPTDKEIQLIYIKTLKCADRLPVYREILAASTDAEEKNNLQYEIARCQFKLGSYKAAYASAKAVSGANKGDALSIMGQCVGKTANSCGDSTFDRKCNYLYAVQLLEQAQANGASGLGGVISSYKSNYPTSSECFDNGNPGSVSLTCWGVSVSPCK